MAVAYSVEAGEVSAGLGGSENVIGRHSVLRVLEADLLDLASRGAQGLDAALDSLGYFRVEAFAKVLLRDTDLETRDRAELVRLGGRNCRPAGGNWSHHARRIRR